MPFGSTLCCSGGAGEVSGMKRGERKSGEENHSTVRGNVDGECFKKPIVSIFPFGKPPRLWSRVSWIPSVGRGALAKTMRILFSASPQNKALPLTSQPSAPDLNTPEMKGNMQNASCPPAPRLPHEFLGVGEDKGGFGQSGVWFFESD